MLRQTSRPLLSIAAFLTALCAIGVAIAGGAPTTAFQQWLQSHGTQFGLKLTEPSEGFAPGFASGEMEVKFGEKMSEGHAAEILQAAVAAFCGSAMALKSDLRPSCSENGVDWLVLEMPDAVTSDFRRAVWSSIKGTAGKPDFGRQETAKSFRVRLIEAPRGEQNDPRFRAIAKANGSFSPNELAERETVRREAEAKARQADAERAEEARRRAAVEAARLKAERPRKVLAGTRVCQMRNDVTWLGFTEAYSKDTDRIQIRIVGAKSTYRFEDRHDVTWDSPDNWRLCE